MNCERLKNLKNMIEEMIWTIDELRLRYNVAYLAVYYLLDLLERIRQDYRAMCLDPY